MINFLDYEYFNDVDIAYSDFIQRITSVKNKIAPFKAIRIKTLPPTGLIFEKTGLIFETTGLIFETTGLIFETTGLIVKQLV